MPRLCFDPQDYAKPIDFELWRYLKSRYNITYFSDNLPMELIVANPDVKFNFVSMSCLSEEFIDANNGKYYAIKDIVSLIAQCGRRLFPCITVEFIEANYNMSFVQLPIYLPGELIISRGWNSSYWTLSHSMCDMDFIDANSDKTWDMGTIYQYWDDERVIDFAPDSGDFRWFSRHANISEEFVRANDDKPWWYEDINPVRNCVCGDFASIEANPKISLEYIVINGIQDKYYFSTNPNLTARFIALNFDIIDIDVFIRSRFGEYYE